MDYDFSGWATRNDLLCSDGRIIRHNAFKDNDGSTVPLVWNHQHNEPTNVLGHCLLENRDDGVYAYCKLNDTDAGRQAKELVQHGDVNALSIYANKLKQRGSDVLHGAIKEVSLVLASANPGAFIDSVIAHGDGSDEEAVIYTGSVIEMYHSDEANDNPDETLEHSQKEEEKVDNEKKTPESTDDKTVGDVLDEMTKEQKDVVAFLISEAIKENAGEDDSEGGNESMKHNVFDNDMREQENVLSHADQKEILDLAKSSGVGSLKEAMNIFATENELSHADISGFAQTGDGNVTTMFPEFVEAHPSNTPNIISDDFSWVDAIMSKTQKVPHGRVRTSNIDIRLVDDMLKGKGYEKGKEKKLTGTYSLVRRTTDPQTVYVRSQLYRDDVIDIEDFDYVAFQYGIDQKQLKETLGLATLLGDGRDDTAEDKIKPEHIRPVWTDDELYTIHKDLDLVAMKKTLQGSDTSKHFGDEYVEAEAMVSTLRHARRELIGISGKGDLFMDPETHATMILARDLNGRRIYNTDAELATALGVNAIYEVPQMAGKVRTDANSKKHALKAILVNFNDYAYGMSKGGDVTHFTDFDIKFNTLESLLETRKSGQLTRIKSALVIETPVSEG